MSLITGAKEKNLKTAKAFSGIRFWMDDYRDLYAEKLTMEFPIAPPGWLMMLSPSETKTHLAWLKRTVKTWEWNNISVFSTNDPDFFILTRDGAGDVHWAGKDGRFESRFITSTLRASDKTEPNRTKHMFACYRTSVRF